MHVQKLTSDGYKHTKRTETQIQKHKSVKFRGIAMFRVGLCWGALFRNYVLPEGLAKEPPKLMKTPKRLDLIGYIMVFNYF